MGYVHDPKALPAFCNLHFTDWIIISQFRNLLCFADFNNGELCLKLAYHYTNICCFVALTIDTLRPISWRLLFSHNNFQFVYCWCIIIRQVSECDCTLFSTLYVIIMIWVQIAHLPRCCRDFNGQILACVRGYKRGRLGIPFGCSHQSK